MKQITLVLSTVDVGTLINRLILKMPILSHLDVEFPAGFEQHKMWNNYLPFKIQIDIELWRPLHLCCRSHLLTRPLNTSETYLWQTPVCVFLDQTLHYFSEDLVTFQACFAVPVYSLRTPRVFLLKSARLTWHCSVLFFLFHVLRSSLS